MWYPCEWWDGDELGTTQVRVTMWVVVWGWVYIRTWWGGKGFGIFPLMNGGVEIGIINLCECGCGSFCQIIRINKLGFYFVGKELIMFLYGRKDKYIII